MDFLLNYLRQSWGSAFLWLTISGTAGYAITSALRETLEEKKRDWKKRVQDSVPMSTSSPTDQHAAQGTMKTSTVTRILILLIITLPAVGYGIRDLQLRNNYSAWQTKQAEWDSRWNDWKIKHPQENADAIGRTETGRRLSTATSTATSSPW
jgi:phage terminase large subunit-like protein